MKNSIFEVDIKGLRELQAGKPIWFVVRELIQNAFDEQITTCSVDFKYERGRAHITVVDDSPEGFSDLSDAYTLFKNTRKRSNSRTRGRFNFGEKQVLCLCDIAKIETTTGSLLFDADGRHALRKKREKGSQVYIVIKMTKDDYQSCISYCHSILVPQNINLTVSVEASEDFRVHYKEPYKKFTSKLLTEISQDGEFKKTTKETEVHIHKSEGVSFIYEMGIPVCEIDCAFSVDVQQKVPLNTDRDNVDHKFLKTIYADVLNQTYEDIDADNTSETWVRVATQSERINKETVTNIFTKRYGDKAVIANPFDKKSIDEAITNGYRVIRSNELSGEELQKAREFGALKTSSEEFPVSYVDFEYIKPSEEQRKVAIFAHKIFTDIMSLSPKLKVEFISSKASVLADFNASDLVLRYNLYRMSNSDFKLTEVKGLTRASVEIIDLTIHELAHFYGTHYEKKYLDAITKIGAQLAVKALEDPEWFDLTNA